MEKILVRVPNWIGDAVMATAALRELRRLLPQSEITLWARPWVADLLRGQELADQVLTAPLTTWSVPEQLRGFDRAVLLQNAFSAAWTVWRAGIRERIGYRTDGRGLLLTRAVRPRSKAMGKHQVFYYLDLLHRSGLSPRDYLNSPGFQPDIRLKAPESGRHRALKLLESAGADPRRRLVVLNPGAHYGSAKRWFAERYAELADRLIQEEDVEIALVGSSGERPLAERIAGLMRERPKILTGKTDLPALMGVLAECDLLVTNDSGPMHLAAALDVPQIALFGSTDEIATGPLSPKARVIHKHVACSPCLLRECPIDLRCFDRIGVEEVFVQGRQVLSRIPASR